MYLKYFPTAVASLRSCGAEAMRLCPESLQAWAWEIRLQALQGILQTHPSGLSPHLQPPHLFLGLFKLIKAEKADFFFPLIPADFIAELDCACLPWAPTMLFLWGHSLELLLLLLTLRNFPMQRNPKKRALNPCCVLFIWLRSSQVCAFPAVPADSHPTTAAQPPLFPKGPKEPICSKRWGFF